MSKHFFVLISIFITFGFINAGLTNEKKDEISNYFDQVKDCIDIPGLQFSLVINNTIEMSLAKGHADLQNERNMTTDTPIVLASVTKGIVSILLAKLLDMNDKYDWDTPIREIIGDSFYLNNWELTDKTSLRDLVTHRLGIKDEGVLNVYYNWDRMDLIKRFRFLEPTHPFRSKWQYANIPYIIAGYVAEVLGGKLWEESLQELFLDPLGMNNTQVWNLNNEDLSNRTAYSYTTVFGERFRISHDSYAQGYVFGPAGYLTSTSDDMAKWTRFLLSNGVTPKGDRLIKQESLNEIFAKDMGRDWPKQFSRPKDPFLFTVGDTYGKGFTQGYYRGYEIIQHSGGIPSFNTLQFLLPDFNAGFFIGMTMQNYDMIYNMGSFVADIIMNEDPYKTANATCEQFKKQKPKPVFDLPPGNFTRELTAYEGKYGHPAFGYASVTLEEGVLYFKYGRIDGRFELLPSAIPDYLKGNATTIASGVFGYTLVQFSKPVDNKMTILRFADEVDFTRDLELPDIDKPLPPKCKQAKPPANGQPRLGLNLLTFVASFMLCLYLLK